MRKALMMLTLIVLLAIQVSAVQYEAPPAPDSVADMVSEEADSFGEGLWNVIKACIGEFSPALSEAAEVCLRVTAAVLLTGLVSGFVTGSGAKAMSLACAVAVGGALLEPSAALIELGTETVRSLSEYGKLLLPVMTAALAAQGGVTASTGLYAATALFDSILSSAISGLMLPLIYLYLGVAVGNAALGEPILEKIKDFIKWLMTWILKIALYVFTGFLGITGVVSGTADAAALKAAKLTISGAVPVVGGILSDASEAVLVGAGLMRSSAGVYGLLTMAALFLAPFVRMGVQYILLKATGALCASFDRGSASTLIGDFTAAMGLILAMTATQTVLLMVSTVCFMKGVG